MDSSLSRSVYKQAFEQEKSFGNIFSYLSLYVEETFPPIYNSPHSFITKPDNYILNSMQITSKNRFQNLLCIEYMEPIYNNINLKHSPTMHLELDHYHALIF